MNSVNTNTKSCGKTLKVLVKKRITKVVDKSRQTTLVLPEIQGAKKKVVAEKNNTAKILQIDNKSHKSANIPVQLVNTLVPALPNMNPIIPPVYPQQTFPPPENPGALTIVPPNQGSNPYTQHVYVPAFIPVAAANAPINQPLTYITPVGAPNMEGNPPIGKVTIRELPENETNVNRTADKYHSSELDYFLGVNTEVLKKSRRARSRSRTPSSYSWSDRHRRKRRRSYSPRSDKSLNLSNFDSLSSVRSGSRYSRRFQSRSRSRSISGQRSRSYGSFRRSRSRSLSLQRNTSNTRSQSPVSDQSFKGSFLTISRASSMDSVHTRSIDCSVSPSRPYIISDELSGDGSLSELRERRSRSRYSHDHEKDLGTSLSHEREHRTTIQQDEHYNSHYNQRRSHHRYHSHHTDSHNLERVSDFEDVSDLEEITDLEDVSDSDDSVLWKDEFQDKLQEQRSETYYETVSDNEETALETIDEVKSKVENLIQIAKSPSDSSKQYDGYLDPRLEKANEGVTVGKEGTIELHQPFNDDAFETISDSELEVSNADDNQEKLTAQTSDGTEVVASDGWLAVSSSAVQYYENLGLMKDENDKLIYVGQPDAGVNNGATLQPVGETSAPLDESFNGFVSTLWQFPHTVTLTMDFKMFCEESEAYKDEFIAEIIHMILSLDLPYITLNKLRNVIREKVNIRLFSLDDLRQVLELYPEIVTLRRQSGSDSDGDGVDPGTNFLRVNVMFEMRLCERHKALPFSQEDCPCNGLHICPFYLLTQCAREDCPLGHDLRTPHNVKIITEKRLHRCSMSEIVNHIRHIDHRGADTVPAVCKFYNRRRGCSKESETDDEEMCSDLHLCFFYVVDKCRHGNDCELDHNIMAGQPFILLNKFGLGPNEFGEFNILSLVRRSLRNRRSELDMLNEKMSNKTLTEKEIALCIARGINVKLLQMMNVKGSFPGSSNDNLSVLGASSEQAVDVMLTDESGKQSVSTIALQLKAQKALVEKALNNTDDELAMDSDDIAGKEKSVIPIICKFYNNETGCARTNELCEFIHVCHHYVTGDCKYGGRCKRSHDLTSGQAEHILTRLGLIYKTESEIIEVLKKLCGKTLATEENLPCSQA